MAQRVWFSYILEGPSHSFKTIETSVTIQDRSTQFVDDLRKAIFAEVGKGLEDYGVKIAPHLVLWRWETLKRMNPRNLLTQAFAAIPDLQPFADYGGVELKVVVTPADSSIWSSPFSKNQSFTRQPEVFPSNFNLDDIMNDYEDDDEDYSDGDDTWDSDEEDDYERY